MEKYGFVYLWYDKKRKMFYVGSHWGTEDDGYICSSNRMRDAYRRRPEDFKRRTIQKNICRNDLLDEEHRWLQMMKKDELGTKYYNIRQHRWGHWSTDVNSRLTVAEKLSMKNTGQGLGRVLSEETKKKIGKSKIGNKNFLGMKHSEKTRQKMSDAAKQRAPTMSGKKHTDETKMKIRLALKGKQKSKEHCEKLSQAKRIKKLERCDHD